MNKERFRAVMLGTALGDTLGMPVEGWKKEQIHKYEGRIIHPIDPVFVKDITGNYDEEDEYRKLKYYTKDFNKGEFTDDTILSLALARALSAGRFDLNDIAQKQLDEYVKRLMPDGTVFGGFGGTTIAGFKN